MRGSAIRSLLLFPLCSPLLALGAVVLTAAPARAESEVDPRYPYTFELAVGPSVYGELRGAGVSDIAWGVRATFLGPIAENVQGMGALWIDTQSHATALAGVRWRTVFDRWETHVDTQLALDMVPRLGIGARGAFGGGYELLPGLRAGAALGVAFVAINPRGFLDAAVTLSYEW